MYNKNNNKNPLNYLQKKLQFTQYINLNYCIVILQLFK